MSSTQKDKSSGKPRQRSRKADQRGSQKPEVHESPKLDQEIGDQISPAIADAPTNGSVPPAEVQVAPAEVPLIDEVTSADASSTDTAAPVRHRPISLQTIAHAYESYTKRSFQQSRSFVEKLMEVRSFDKAIEVQTEFATLAYVNFVAESQKICELYNELARQMFTPWQRFTAEVTQGQALNPILAGRAFALPFRLRSSQSGHERFHPATAN